MSSTDLRALDRRIVVAAETLIHAYQMAGNQISITRTLSTRAQQARLYRRYLQGLSSFPAAPPGKSLHERGLAFDVSANSRVLASMGKVWQRWGGRWGGSFRKPDPIHFDVKL